MKKLTALKQLADEGFFKTETIEERLERNRKNPFFYRTNFVGSLGFLDPRQEPSDNQVTIFAIKHIGSNTIARIEKIGRDIKDRQIGDFVLVNLTVPLDHHLSIWERNIISNIEIA